MTTQEIWAAAMRQSAIDLNCSPADFTCGHSVVVESAPHPRQALWVKLSRPGEKFDLLRVKKKTQ